MTAQFFTIFSSPESDCRCQVLFYHVSGLANCSNGCCCCCRPHISIFRINDAAEIGGSNPWLNLGPHCKNIGSIVS